MIIYNISINSSTSSLRVAQLVAKRIMVLPSGSLSHSVKVVTCFIFSNSSGESNRNI